LKKEFNVCTQILKQKEIMRNLILSAFLVAMSLIVNAQGLYNNGCTMVITSGTYLVNTGNYVNATYLGNHGRIDLDGAFLIKGHWTNDASAENVLINVDTDGLICFNGTNSIQTVGGTGNFTNFERLTVESNAILHVPAGKAITVNGILSVNIGGTMVLKTPASLSPAGSLITLSSVVNLGTSQSERYITSNAFHHVSSPVDNQNVSLFTVVGPYTNNNFYLYDETTADSWDASGSTVGVSGYQRVLTGTMDEGNGYTIYYPNYDPTYVFSGQYNTGTFVKSVTNTPSGYDTKYDGWNFLGNPYPSALDWNTIGKTNVANSIYYYNGTNYVYYVAGGLNEGLGIGANVDAGVNGRYIPAHQGFFVKCTNTGGGSITMTNASRTHTSQNFFRGELDNNVLRIETSSNGYKDEAVLRFLPTANSEFDSEYDAYKMFSSNKQVPQIYTLTPFTKTEMAINTMPSTNDLVQVKLGLNAPVAGTYKLTAKQVFVGQNTSVFLEDKYTNTIVDLINNPEYSFSTLKGNQSDRFILHLSATPNIQTEFVDKDADVNIYAFESSVNVKIKSTDFASMQDAQIEIYNMLGKKILNHKINSDFTRIQLSVSDGNYIVKVRTTEKTVNKKVFIQR